MSRSSTGFTLVETLLGVIAVALVVFVGYYIYHTQKSADSTYQSVSNEAKTSPPKTTVNPGGVEVPAGYLGISEWHVEMKLTAADIKNATYQLVTDNKYLKPSAFLSTTALDASQACTRYYKQGATPDNLQPTFQFIERYPATASIPIDEAGDTVSAPKAVSTNPNMYKLIGNYLYAFEHGNGSPCPEQTSQQLLDFESAFKTLQAY